MKAWLQAITFKNMDKRPYVLAGVLAFTACFATQALAAGPSANHLSLSTISGTVGSVSGNTITLTGKNSKTYTVDATKAKITKVTAPTTTSTKPTITTITVGDIQSGDTLKIMGKVSGTNVTATRITDGAYRPMVNKNKEYTTNGTVTAVSNNTITITIKNKTTYTVDATNAKIYKFVSATAGAKPTLTTITVSDIKVGDHLRVNGTVSGTNITATKITDNLTSLVAKTHKLNKNKNHK